MSLIHQVSWNHVFVFGGSGQLLWSWQLLCGRARTPRSSSLLHSRAWPQQGPGAMMYTDESCVQYFVKVAWVLRVCR